MTITIITNTITMTKTIMNDNIKYFYTVLKINVLKKT